MKKSYETPSAEKISFNYRDQVVAASGYVSTGCPMRDDITNIAGGNSDGCYI